MQGSEGTIQEALQLLQRLYGATPQDIKNALEGPSIPATIFSETLTPFEAVCTYLAAQSDTSFSQIAHSIHRNSSSVRNALQNAKQKEGQIHKPETTPYRIPLHVFHDERLSPAEAIIHHLATYYGMSNAHIARLMHRDPRNTHKQYQNACRKLGGAA